MRTAFLVLVAASLVAGCIAPSPQVVDAARRGRADAEQDVAARRPRFAVIGLVGDEESPLDPSTGLAKFSVGCCKSYERMAYCDAYNAVFDAARRDGRLAGATLERKTTTRGAVESMFASRKAVEVRLDAPGVDAPGGRFRVEAGPGGLYEAAALWRVDRATGVRRELRYLGADVATALFDDAGETFVRDDAARAYVTFDLPSALVLQVFPDARVDR